MGNQVSTQPQLFKTDTVVIGSGATAAMSAVQGVTIVGSLSTSGTVLFNIPIVEKTVISSLSAGGTITYDLDTQTVLYYTGRSTGNWTLNFRGSSTVPLSTRIPVGGSIKADFITTNNTIGYYCTGVSVDGVAASLAWPRGILSAGNVQSSDIYSFNIFRLDTTTFKVLGNMQGSSTYYAATFHVFAGGGGGGAGVNASSEGAGGGAGGYVTGSVLLSAGVTYNFTVGAGGPSSTSGQNSIGFGLTAVGGGYGSFNTGNGAVGGSGGGSYATSGPVAGTAGQGNAGGIRTGVGGAGGGGGAGSAGGNSTTGVGGTGGAGLSSTISGALLAYCAGGGGEGNSTGGAGGSGIGGTGATSGVGGAASPASRGSGGGGGASSGSQLGGAGSGGQVVLRLLTAYFTNTTTGSPTVTTDGAYTVITFNSSGSYTA